ncbi:uncharacterized protein LOC127835001 [Dreissena polymorpha]|uniref:Major facilitator superfamily (MFS) profile domain-containing protein n=1 Tax=Dreissena polymorpha TaxID=45954 RepID=A0A9D4GB57_DREPO|nr:uncharacterized protein LOC127835001 [Dreissena polymorpha]XP_052217126.1 uncharacterized protein LOC127835001 [Dreissena polymorpha]XP_052217127.1 uncharacterized protein LOC127835001 [Dreissena polymorpha]KAH3812399.1 hypothetical protein DPMN_140830 [Dreissena polymorpha]
MTIDKSQGIASHEPEERLVVHGSDSLDSKRSREKPRDIHDAALDKNRGLPIVHDAALDKSRGLPIDRGWAWIVLGAAFFYLIIFGGIRKNFGIFFVEFQSRFNSSASITSSLTTIQNLVMSIASPFIMTIGLQFLSNRMCIIIGSLVLTVAFIITSQATDIRILFVSIGLLEGIGTAMVHPPVTATVSEYFNKRRGFAMSFAMSGANFGGLVFAPIMSALFESVGFTGTLMIVAGMALNVCISGMLMRPIQSFARSRGGEPRSTKTDGDDQSLRDVIELDVVESHKLLEVNGNSHFANSSDAIITNLIIESDCKEQNGIAVQNKLILQLKKDADVKRYVRSGSFDSNKTSHKDDLSESALIPRARAWSTGNKRSRTVSEPPSLEVPGVPGVPLSALASPLLTLLESLSHSRIAIHSNTADGVCGSVVDVQALKPEAPIENGHAPLKTQRDSIWTKLKTSFDISIFRRTVFPLFLCVAGLLSASSILIPAFLAPLAKDAGLTPEQRGLLLSATGGAGMVSRITLSLLADKQFIKLTTILAAVSVAIGVTVHLLRFVHGFGAFVVVAIMMGICCEIYQAMYPVILVEYLTLSRLRSCIGFTILCHGFAVAGTFLLVGFFRDTTGSYFASYHLLGTMAFIGAGLSLCIPILYARLESSASSKVKESVAC